MADVCAGIADFTDLTTNHVTRIGPYLQIMPDADDFILAS